MTSQQELKAIKAFTAFVIITVIACSSLVFYQYFTKEGFQEKYLHNNEKASIERKYKLVKSGDPTT